MERYIRSLIAGSGTEAKEERMPSRKRTQTADTITSAIQRLDASGSEVKRIVQAVVEQLQPTDEPEALRQRGKQGAGAFQALDELPVALVGGKRRTLRQVIGDMKEGVDPEEERTITARRIWDDGPLAALGRIPVATRSDAMPDADRVRDFFPILGERSDMGGPVFGPNPRGHTFRYNFHKSWWTALVYTRYKAETQGWASGLEAAAVKGGLYAKARDVCLTLEVPSDADPSTQFTLAFVKAASCMYAQSTPELDYPCLSLSARVCNCFIKNSLGECLWSDPDRADECSFASGTRRSKVTATHSVWLGPVCAGVSSTHAIQFEEGIGLYKERC